MKNETSAVDDLSAHTTESGKASMRDLVFLVHGTGAASPKDVGDQWWQLGGAIESALSTAFEGRFDYKPFHWSGANSEKARRQAGSTLAAAIKEAAKNGVRVHLIGHSHGGSVIWHALIRLAASHPGVLDAVASTCSVGTPYLKYGARRAELLTGVLFAALTLVLAGWLLRFAAGAHLGLSFTYDPWGTFGWGLLTSIVTIAALVTSVGLIAALHGVTREWRLRKIWSRLSGLSDHFLALWSVQDEPTLGLVSSGSLDHSLTRWKSVTQLVNNVLARSLQGSDLGYLELREVSPHALPTLANRSLPSQVDVRLVERANAAASILAGAARGVLLASSNPVTGLQSLKELLPEKLTFKELVHTTYFDDDACRQLVVLHIGANGGFTPEFVDPALVDWYRNRRLEAPTISVVKFPSNRLGRYVTAVAVLSATSAALAAVAGQLLAERAVSPTTSAFWVHRLALDRTPLEAMSRGNYEDFRPVVRRLIKLSLANGVDEKAAGALLRDALDAWPGPVRIAQEHIAPLIQQAVQAGLLRVLLDSDFFNRLDDIESQSLANTRIRQLAIELATGTAVVVGADSALIERLRDACQHSKPCTDEAVVREIEALALIGRREDAKQLLLDHPGLDATYREKTYPDYVSRPSKRALPLERIVDTVIWLANNGMPRAAMRLAQGKLQWCASEPHASKSRDVDGVVKRLLSGPVWIKNPYPSARLDDHDLQEGAIELAACGPLSGGTLDLIEQAFSADSKFSPRLDRAFMARAQAYRSNCDALASRKAFDTREVLKHLSSLNLCPKLGKPTIETRPVNELRDEVSNKPLRAAAIKAFETLYSQASTDLERDSAINAFLSRIYAECSNDSDSADHDAFITFVNLELYLRAKKPAANGSLPAAARQLGQSIFRERLPGCIGKNSEDVAQALEARVMAASALVRWSREAAPSFASTLESEALTALRKFRHPNTHGSTPTDLYALEVRMLLKSHRYRDAFEWLKATDMGEPLRFHRQLALLEVALCANSQRDHAVADAAFTQAASLGLDAWRLPSYMQSAFAVRLSDWFSSRGDWRSAFTFCERCDAAVNVAVSDWVLMQMAKPSVDLPDGCQSSARENAAYLQ